MNKYGVPVLLSLVFILTVISCVKDTTNSDYLDNADCSGIDTDANTYTKSIKAILDTHCATSGCHDAFAQSEGVDLSDYANAKNGFENQDCLCSIHHGSGCTPMPEGASKLSDAIIQKLDCWAKNGYLQ